MASEHAKPLEVLPCFKPLCTLQGFFHTRTFLLIVLLPRDGYPLPPTKKSPTGYFMNLKLDLPSWQNLPFSRSRCFHHDFSKIGALKYKRFIKLVSQLFFFYCGSLEIRESLKTTIHLHSLISLHNSMTPIVKFQTLLTLFVSVGLRFRTHF